MQAYDRNEFPLGPVVPFDEDVIKDLLDHPDVDHVKKFSMAGTGPCKTPCVKRIRKNRQRNKSARKMRAKQRRK